jgi:hypothetical protein
MKICKEENCSYPVFGGGYCKNHQWCRQDKNKPIVSTSINDRKQKHIKPKKVTGELELFKEIWNERIHKSEISGLPLSLFDVKCFHHILTKQAYPEHRLDKDNIILLTRSEHISVHSKSIDDQIGRASCRERVSSPV